MKRFLLLSACLSTLIIGFYFYYSNILRHATSVSETFVSHQTVPATFDGIRIVHFSDVLIEDETDLLSLENAIHEINELNPDIVTFTGNLFVQSVVYRDQTVELLSEINTTIGKVATLGFRDDNETIEVLEAASFTILQSEAIPLFNGTIDSINVIGAHPNMARDQLESLLDDFHIEGAFNVLLINEPTFASISPDFDIILQLSGFCLGSRRNSANCAQFHDGIYQFADIFTLNVNTGMSGGILSSITSRGPKIDSFLLSAQ